MPKTKEHWGYTNNNDGFRLSQIADLRGQEIMIKDLKGKIRAMGIMSVRYHDNQVYMVKVGIKSWKFSDIVAVATDYILLQPEALTWVISECT